jgi:hypothetical protein
VDLDLRKVNVLIGDQGTGKSTVAKVLSVIKGASQLLLGRMIHKINGIESNENEIADLKNERFSTQFFDLLKQYDLINYISNMTYIFFENDNFICKIENSKTYFSHKIINENEEIIKDTSLNHFIPAYRESYILLRNSYPAILIANAKLPQLLNQFGQQFNNYRKELKYFDLKNIIGVDYRYFDNSDLIVLQTGAVITFEESSSAVNSVVPMLVVFLGVVNNMSQDNYRIYYNHNCPFITIEEPELNCYPSTQKKLLEFLIEKIKFKNKYKQIDDYYCNLLLTTHSPYILTSLNNLMYAYNVGKEHFEETDRIVPSKNWLNPNDVSVYKLVNGNSESIMDEELKQIKIEEIDGISEVLSAQWHEMAELNMVKH